MACSIHAGKGKRMKNNIFKIKEVLKDGFDAITAMARYTAMGNSLRLTDNDGNRFTLSMDNTDGQFIAYYPETEKACPVSISPMQALLYKQQIQATADYETNPYPWKEITDAIALCDDSYPDDRYIDLYGNVFDNIDPDRGCGVPCVSLSRITILTGEGQDNMESAQNEFTAIYERGKNRGAAQQMRSAGYMPGVKLLNNKRLSVTRNNEQVFLEYPETGISISDMQQLAEILVKNSRCAESTIILTCSNMLIQCIGNLVMTNYVPAESIGVYEFIGGCGTGIMKLPCSRKTGIIQKNKCDAIDRMAHVVDGINANIEAAGQDGCKMIGSYKKEDFRPLYDVLLYAAGKYEEMTSRKEELQRLIRQIPNLPGENSMYEMYISPTQQTCIVSAIAAYLADNHARNEEILIRLSERMSLADEQFLLKYKSLSVL